MSYELERTRDTRRPFTLVELDLDYCSLLYGEAPCTAALGVTGAAKCFNTRSTCQDAVNYARSTKTYRFCSNVADLPRDLGALPLLQSVTIVPAKLKVGSGLGERGGCTVTLRDGRHNDVGIDKYVAERPYDPEQQGTILGRLAARNTYFLGRTIRVMQGYLVQSASGASVFDAANFRTRTYFIESLAPPAAGGSVVITGKDILKLADDERAKAPRPAQGRLLAGITNVAGTATLTPAGVGDLAYSAAGKLRINGEVMSFTRSGDTLTLAARGQYNTVAAAHAADDAVQECLEIVSQNAHAIINTLLTDYAGVPEQYIPLADWQHEDVTYNARLYSALIAEPTGVGKLVGEICEQAPAAVAWDDVNAEILYRAIRPASAVRALNDAGHFVGGSIAVTQRLDLRVSQCIVYFGQRDPTEPVDKRSNYAAAMLVVGSGESVNKYGQPRVKEIFGRWLPSTARTFAQDLANLIITRYDDAPAEIAFSLLPKDELNIADLFTATSHALQGADGAAGTATFQVLSAQQDFGSDEIKITALQERFSGAQVATRTLSVAIDSFNYNLREAHDQIYGAPTGPVDVVCTIEVGVVVGSKVTFSRGAYLGGGQWEIQDGNDDVASSFIVGDWPTGSTITVFQDGNVQGIGGRGGGSGGLVHNSGHADIGGLARGNNNGARGGCALYARVPVTWHCRARLWGGGGGGLKKIDHDPPPSGSYAVFGFGGGGAGVVAGVVGSQGSGTLPTPGTDTTGGPGGTLNGKTGGSGGDPGLPGHSPSAYSTGGGPIPTVYSGLAGPAINGASLVTLVLDGGTVLGPQIN